MATLHHNISGQLTKELLAVGDSIKVKKISLTNTHATTMCTVDLYIAKTLLGKFYLFKGIELPVGVTLIYDDIKFNNNAKEFGLFIKLTQSASETPSVDVIIN